MKFSDSANRLQGQSMFKLLDRANELEKNGQNLIHFEIGDPNFDTPEIIKRFAIAAINSDFTHYTSSAGLPKLREEISKFYEDYFSCKFESENVVIAPGCNPLIYSLIECLVNRDENVIITDPGFPTYSSVLNFLGIEANFLPLREENQFCPDFKELVSKINSKTRMIILNSPNNPTGSVMDPSEILEIIKYAKTKDIIVVCDEIYSLLSYTPILFSACEFLREYDNVAVISGFSKAFAMSGWRVGYLIAEKTICDKIALLLQTTVSCTNTFIQEACSAALFHAHDELHNMKHEYMRRRNYMVDRLNSIPKLKCNLPMGAFYVFVNIEETDMTDEEFCEKMLKAGVVILPGNSFGPNSNKYVRLCFTRPLSEIQEGLNRIERGMRL